MDAFEIHTITAKVWRYSKVFLKGVYLLHFIPRLLGIVVFSTYDTLCAVNENASIFDCAQEFPVRSPKDWILCWLVSSILSSVAFYFICCSHEPLRHMQKKYKNLYLITLMILFLITLASFFIRFFHTEPKDMALVIALLLWWPSTIAQIIYLNNQRPPQDLCSKSQYITYNVLQEADSLTIIANPGNQSNTQWFYIVYYTSLVFQCLECCAMALAISIDAIGMLVPVAVIHGDVHGRLFTYSIKFFITMRSLCIYAITLLYFQKLCHGDRTLFATPGDPLEPQQHELNQV